jgi:antitoxin component YwqK of YwqJK toxin-antitoxin module
MKTLIKLSLLLVIVSNVVLAQTKKMEIYFDPLTKTKISERYYLNGNNEKEGKYQSFNGSGYVINDINYVKGEKNGEAKFYDNYTGKLMDVENYLKGQLHGKSTHYEIIQGISVLSEEKYFDNGKLMKEISYWQNGKKKKETIHKGDGSYNDITSIKAWEMDGKEKYIGEPEFSEKKFYDNGSLESQKNPTTGQIKIYWTNGNIKEDYVVDKDGKKSGVYYEYWQNNKGAKKYETNYVNGLKDGYFKSWYQNGQIDDSVKCVNGKEEGIGFNHDEQGKIIASYWHFGKRYERGTLESVTQYIGKHEENYKAFIKNGDEFFKNKEYQKALDEYRSAYRLKEDEQYPKNKMEEVKAIIYNMQEH